MGLYDEFRFRPASWLPHSELPLEELERVTLGGLRRAVFEGIHERERIFRARRPGSDALHGTGYVLPHRKE